MFQQFHEAVSQKALHGLTQHLCIKGMGCLFQCPNLPYLCPSSGTKEVLSELLLTTSAISELDGVQVQANCEVILCKLPVFQRNRATQAWLFSKLT